jgi:hypothetical protein
MKGLWSTVEEVEAGMKLKIGKMIGKMGKEGLSLIGKTRKEFKEEIEQNLKKGREYILDRARSSPLKSSLKEAS